MSIIEDAKTVVSAVQQINNLPLYKQILDLWAGIQGVVAENSLLKQKILELDAKLSIQEDFEFRNNAYWKKSSGEGPFCVPCWDSKKLLMRMTGDDGEFSCHTCNYSYQTEEAKENMRRLMEGFNR